MASVKTGNGVGITETPSQVHGRLNEAMHIAGYAFERAWGKLEWLLEDEARFGQVGTGFQNVNDFLATVQLPKGIDPEQRKAVAKRIKELQPAASQRKIAGTLGVDEGTVRNDIGRHTAESSAPEETEANNGAPFGGVTAESSASTVPTEPAGDVVAREAERRAEKIAKRVRRDVEAEESRIQEAARQREQLEVGVNVDMRHGDFREVLADVADRSVSAVITDPPYPKEFLPLLADLAQWADRVLVDDGVLAVLFGQTYLPEVYSLLSGGRPYRWTMAYHTPGDGYVSHSARVQSNWKPVLVYGGGPRFGDVVRSDDIRGESKAHHEWGQDYAAFHELVARLTVAGDVVVDPFAGSGTTLVAAHAQGRHAIGCDIDWLQEYGPPSSKLSVTNLDYVLEEHRQKKLMLIEEKQSGGIVHKAQGMTFDVLDGILRAGAPAVGYEYVGLYVLRMPSGCTMPGPGMTLNGTPITAEQLSQHIHFEKCHCKPFRYAEVA